MLDPIELSVIIVTYKSIDHISRCLQSIRKATQELSTEIIIVDNASRDGLADLIQTDFREIILMENEKNEGFARAVNQGVRRASGDYLAIVNPDTQLASGSLKLLLNFLKEHRIDCIVGVRTVDEIGRPIPSCRSLPHIGNIMKYPLLFLLQGKKLIKPRRYLIDLWEPKKTIDVTKYNGYITGACIVTRLGFFKKMGMFDEKYFLYCEDADFGFRLGQAGYPAYVVPEVSIIHSSGLSASQNPRSRLYFVHAYLRYIHKNFPFFHGLLYEASFFVIVLNWALWALLRMKWNEVRILLQALMSFLSSRFGKPTNFGGSY